MNKAQALKILNLEENPSKKQIENRFENLTRRIKNGEELDSAKIKEAYDLLLGRERYKRNEGKLTRLFNQYIFDKRGWIFLVSLSAVILAIIAVPIFFRRVPDLTVSFAGKYGFIDQDIMAEVLSDGMPETDDILVEVMYMDEEGESAEYDSGGRTRLSGLLISEEADILLLDSQTYNYVRSDNALMSLEGILDELSVEIPGDRLVYGVDFETGDKRVYGILAEDSYLVYRTVYGSDEKIICIAAKTGHLEDSVKAIDIILTYGSD